MSTAKTLFERTLEGAGNSASPPFVEGIPILPCSTDTPRPSDRGIARSTPAPSIVGGEDQIETTHHAAMHHGRRTNGPATPAMQKTDGLGRLAWRSQYVKARCRSRTNGVYAQIAQSQPLGARPEHFRASVKNRFPLTNLRTALRPVGQRTPSRLRATAPPEYPSNTGWQQSRTHPACQAKAYPPRGTEPTDAQTGRKRRGAAFSFSDGCRIATVQQTPARRTIAVRCRPKSTDGRQARLPATHRQPTSDHRTSAELVFTPQPISETRTASAYRQRFRLAAKARAATC